MSEFSYITGEEVEVSYIIPHKGRDHILLWHLEELNHQVFRDFEVIVVVDEDESDLLVADADYGYKLTVHYLDKNRGPATARNVGAKLAKGKILLFVGDDCMPAPDLIARHWLSHKQHGKNVTQGYTPWHPKAQTPFMEFLNKTGLQANWNALRNEDGGWMRDVSAGFCLTTNYSIKKKRFWQIGGFDESFSGAAWEDIELGYRLNKFGESATFAPEAVNYHYHKYELPDFLKRCFMEGTHRLSICFPHPEMGPSLLEPKQLRAVADIDVGDIQSQAMTVNSPNMDEVWGLWSATCQAFSFKGVQHSIDAGFPGLQALYYAEENTEVIEIVAGTASVKNGRWAYALHCAEWMLTRRPDHWYTYAFAAETKKAIGDIDGALFLTRSAIIKNPAAAWPQQLLRELST